MRPTLRMHLRATARGLAAALALGLVAACADDDDPVSQLRTPTVALFAPSTGSIPTPNDLLFAGSTDGTLNIPIADPSFTADPAIALNTLDGWSTVAPITIQFSRALDPTTVVGNSTVRLFEVTTFSDPMTPVGGPVITADLELVEGIDYALDLPSEYGGRAIQIQPLVPFQPSTAGPGGNSSYMVIVTNGVRDADGVQVQRDTEYLFASVPVLGMNPPPPPELVQLNALVNSQLNAYATASNDPREDVVMSFTFTTQSVSSALGTLLGVANGQEQTIIDNLCAILGTCGGDTSPSPFSTPFIRQVNMPSSELGTASELIGGAPGVARVFAGIFKTPYYSAQSTNSSFQGLTNDPTALTTPWRARYALAPGVTARNVTRFNPLPTARSCQQIPLLISIPDSNVVPMPVNGYPIVIFQHGITRNRTDMIYIAETLAQIGLAAVAIDLPLHGIGPNEPLPDGTEVFVGYNNMIGQPDDVWERTFGIDLFTSGTSTFAPDGVVDPSGTHFVNLQNLAVTRDNFRQGIVDLINLRAALATLTILGTDMTDETNVHFIGHSLGGIVGTPFVAVQPGLTAATLGMAGSSLPYLLGGSTAFGQVVEAALAANGILSGTPAFDQYFWAAQTAVDAVDPINYAGLAGAGATPLYLIEIVGGGPGGSPPDLVIPNSVPGAPFAGTEPLIDALGLASVSTTITDINGLKAAVRFTEGNHSSLLFPGFNQAEMNAFDEIQAQVASFHSSDGQTITVTNQSVVQ